MDDAVKYIKKCLKMGIEENVINSQLKEAGWDDTVISEAWFEVRTKKTFSLPSFASLISIARPQYLKYAVAIVAVCIAFGGGYFAYAKFMSSPGRIWSKALANQAQVKSFHSAIEIAYSDDSKTESNLEKIGLTLKAVGDYFRGETKKSDYSLRSDAEIQLGPLRLGFGAETKKVGDNFFYKISGNPFAALAGLDDSSGQTKTDWIKINLTKGAQLGSTGNFYLNQEKLESISESLKNPNLIGLTKKIGSEQIGDVDTWHYQGEISAEELEKIINSIAEKLEIKNTDSLKPFIQKLEFKAVEIWIGKSDKRIHKTFIESNAPSMMGAFDADSASSAKNNLADIPFTGNLKITIIFSGFDVGTAINEPEGAVDYDVQLEKQRMQQESATALGDARQVMTALELFFNDKNAYPRSITELVPDYLFTLPKPIKDQSLCTGINDFYNYFTSADLKGYAFEFCLSETTGGFSPGKHTASQAGID
ncbi:MAG: hypothetical protein Q8R08_03225 [bacterium]|nr:hypothetical protein [bacterium]